MGDRRKDIKIDLQGRRLDERASTPDREFFAAKALSRMRAWPTCSRAIAFCELAVDLFEGSE
jgi:hypothetical protein